MKVIPIQVIQEEVIIPLTYFPRESELELLVQGDVAIVRPKTAVFDAEDTAVAAERDAFLRLHPKLWEQYPEQYVAIHGGELVDHDPDMGALLKRIDAQYPGTFVLIRQVRQQAEIVYQHRSVRWVEG